MTRINLVSPSLLCDQHLLAEFREITRIPNCLISGKYQYNYDDAPTEYTLGKGHVKFFVNKLRFLHNRYVHLFLECKHRGFRVVPIWPNYEFPSEVYRDYVPTLEALRINNERIRQRMPANPRWSGQDKRFEVTFPRL